MYGSQLHNLFSTATPVTDELISFARWVAGLPRSRRPATAAYPTVDDPFAELPVRAAQAYLSAHKIRTVYADTYPASISTAALTRQAENIAESRAQVVVIGSIEAPSVATLVREFSRLHYNPKIVMATAGPEQGQAFPAAIGAGDVNGIMVPGGWYGGYGNALSDAMVSD